MTLKIDSRLEGREMIAFHGDPAIKAKYVERMKAHIAADELIHGVYWTDYRGCAVGCTLHSGEHKNAEAEIGFPTALMYLEDRLFESVPRDRDSAFALAFLESTPVGADLSFVIPKFLLWLLIDPDEGVIKFVDGIDKTVIETIVQLVKRKIIGDDPSDFEWYNARLEVHTASFFSVKNESYVALNVAYEVATDQSTCASNASLWGRGNSEAQKDYLLYLLSTAPVIAAT